MASRRSNSGTWAAARHQRRRGRRPGLQARAAEDALLEGLPGQCSSGKRHRRLIAAPRRAAPPRGSVSSAPPALVMNSRFALRSERGGSISQRLRAVTIAHSGKNIGDCELAAASSGPGVKFTMTQRGFTLIDADDRGRDIGILAAVAMPAYQTTRARQDVRGDPGLIACRTAITEIFSLPEPARANNCNAKSAYVKVRRRCRDRPGRKVTATSKASVPA